MEAEQAVQVIISRGGAIHASSSRFLRRLDANNHRVFSVAWPGVPEQYNAERTFATSNVRADLMIVGEAPGAQEDAAGFPSRARPDGDSPRSWHKPGLSRDPAYLANVVHCRPPANRRPHPDETAHCWDYLDAQIALVRPRVILALGSTAVRRLLGPGAFVGESRGRSHSLGDASVVVTYHPAAINQKKGRKELVRDDFALAKRLLDEQPNAEIAPSGTATSLPGRLLPIPRGCVDQAEALPPTP